MAKNYPIPPDAFIVSLAVGVAAFAEGYLSLNLSFGLVTGAVGFAIALACFDAVRGGRK